MKLLPNKKILWLFLIILFTFDDIFSYYAIKYLHGKEANLLIARFVEQYPLLYFLLIPITVLIVYLIYYIIKCIVLVILKKYFKKKIIERVVLGGLVVYWFIGNSSVNIIFLFGYRINNMWSRTMILGLLMAVFYAAVMLYKELKKKVLT